MAVADRLEELGMELRIPGYNACERLFHYTTFSDFPWVVTSIYDLCVYFRMGNPKDLTESGSGELGIIVCGRVPWLYQ